MSDTTVRHVRSEMWTLGEGANVVTVRAEVDDYGVGEVVLGGREPLTPDEARQVARMLDAAADACDKKGGER